MEYLIILMIVVGLYFISPCNLMNRICSVFKKGEDGILHDGDSLDGGVYGNGKLVKSVKRKTRKRTTKTQALKPKRKIAKTIKRKKLKKKLKIKR
jgi:hypothetical protein